MLCDMISYLWPYDFKCIFRQSKFYNLSSIQMSLKYIPDSSMMVFAELQHMKTDNEMETDVRNKFSWLTKFFSYLS